jgi:trehalose/maltose hydrolase-like predicted phosphorylase
LGAYVGDGRLAPPAADALDALDAARREGYETLLRSHRSAWADRWERADVVIEGDPELQRAVRFCLFHLMASVAGEGEAAVGARGLSGEGYRGHVFWDADVYVLPFLAATHPSSARAMLEYRVRRLPAARAAAAAEGRRGARFPWESARTGVDVTPDEIIDLAGRRRAVRTGEMEVHIVADVAWAAAWYLDWTGDEAFATGPGRELLIETARYWTSRIRLDEHGRGHIDGVIGPDEYHEDVDDNAYTNVMARWNLRRTADLVLADPRGGQEGEAEAWRSLADALVDGYDPGTGRYEQFAGFYGLEPVLIAEEAHRRPIAADVVLGPERVAEAQIVKQPDVLMLHHLVPGEVAEDSLVPNLDFYEPRTAHGSSLSPGVHAALCARAGRTDEALEALRLAARIDLDDLTGTTAAGLHMAAMGSVWKALAMGFAGLRPIDGALAVDPRVPEAWRRLEIPVELRGVRARLIAHADGFSVEAEGPLEVLVGEERIGVDADAPLRVRGTSGAWEVEDR